MNAVRHIAYRGSVPRLLAICAVGISADIPARTVGTLELGGNPTFTCDGIAQTNGPERRWHSFPGGRLTLNPASKGAFVIDPTPRDLALDLGGYVGTEVLRLPKVVRMALVNADGTESAPASQRTDWYPHQLVSHAAYADGAAVSVADFFVNADSSLLRVMDVRHAGARQLRLSAEVSGDRRVEWKVEKKALLLTGPNFHVALTFANLPAEASPACTASGWSLLLPLHDGGGRFLIGFGFATRGEGGEVAVLRAQRTLSRPPEESLASTRAVMETFLRKVPAPAQWGLNPSLAGGVTPEQQRQAYYIAWAFVHQSLIDAMPENPKYPFPQMSVGKGALWADGEASCPATCSWESLLGLQWLLFVDPETAWRAYVGIMSLVDEHGQLGGESLPSRKAETAWRLHQQAPDRKRLAEVYPAIKRYLLWREANPRWIWGNNKAVHERDLEFVVSWLYDIGFAERIAAELGLADDAQLWRSKVAPAIGNMRDWFFSDPQRLHQLYFVDRKVHATSERSSERPIMTLSALWFRPLPDDMSARLIALLREMVRPELANAGFNYTKYPDNQFVALGLLDRGLPEARPFIEAILRDSIRAGEFAEVLVPGKDGLPALEGVKPSLFTALNTIDFTWLLNQVRCDTGRPLAFPLPSPPKDTP